MANRGDLLVRVFLFMFAAAGLALVVSSMYAAPWYSTVSITVAGGNTVRSAQLYFVNGSKTFLDETTFADGSKATFSKTVMYNESPSTQSTHQLFEILQTFTVVSLIAACFTVAAVLVLTVGGPHIRPAFRYPLKYLSVITTAGVVGLMLAAPILMMYLLPTRLCNDTRYGNPKAACSDESQQFSGYRLLGSSFNGVRQEKAWGPGNGWLMAFLSAGLMFVAAVMLMLGVRRYKTEEAAATSEEYATEKPAAAAKNFPGLPVTTV
jgi:hypothetical protein